MWHRILHPGLLKKSLVVNDMSNEYTDSLKISKNHTQQNYLHKFLYSVKFVLKRIKSEIKHVAWYKLNLLFHTKPIQKCRLISFKTYTWKLREDFLERMISITIETYFSQILCGCEFWRLGKSLIHTFVDIDQYFMNIMKSTYRKFTIQLTAHN